MSLLYKYKNVESSNYKEKRFMKLVIDKKLRLIALSGSTLFIILVSFLLFNSFKNSGFKEEKSSLYNYKSNEGVDYKVLLKPNALYSDGTTLGQGSIIFSEFIDNVKTNFTYQFEGERAADIKGDYEIIALVEGLIGNDKEQKIIWQKTFPILQKETFETKNKIVSIEKEVVVNLEEYKSFAQSVIASTRVDPQTRISVVMNINLKAVTDKGVIDQKASPSITMPLNSSYFEIAKNQAQEKSEAIEEVKKVQLPVNKKMVIAYSIVLGILVLVLIYIIFFITGVVNINLQEKELKNIFKNHRDRMVALSDNIAFTSERYYSVWSIEDLIKISDELGRPIMYKFSRNINNIKQFYVCDDKFIYTFDVGERIIECKVSGIDNKNQVEA
jgi:preprotein translocase subunit SecE